MTLERYTPERLEEQALKLLDLASALRKLALDCRSAELADVPLHGHKADEWLGRLSAWVRDCQARVATATFRAAGQAEARRTAAQSPK